MPAIDVFTPEGPLVREADRGRGSPSNAFPNGIAVDGGVVYSGAEPPGGSLARGLGKLDAATGECIPAACTPVDPEPIYGVAVDGAAGTIFTSGLLGAEDGTEGPLPEY